MRVRKKIRCGVRSGPIAGERRKRREKEEKKINKKKKKKSLNLLG